MSDKPINIIIQNTNQNINSGGDSEKAPDPLPSKKRLKTKHKITIVAALIGFAGVIIAAFIMIDRPHEANKAAGSGQQLLQSKLYCDSVISRISEYSRLLEQRISVLPDSERKLNLTASAAKCNEIKKYSCSQLLIDSSKVTVTISLIEKQLAYD